MPSSGRTGNIPLNKLSCITDRKFILRHDGDGALRVPHNRFHRDDYYILGVVLSGVFRLSVDFEEITVAEGNAIIIIPGQIHSSSSGNVGRGFALVMAPELLSGRDVELIREYSLAQMPITLAANDINDITSLYEILKGRSGRYGSAEIGLVGALKDIVIDNIVPSYPDVATRYKRILIGLQSLLDKHIAEIKSPSLYAAMLNVSGVYLNEAVRAVTGKSVSSFVGEYIVTLAKRRLIYTTLTIQEIANELGFEDCCYFSRLFKRHEGVSPKAFRSKYLE